MERCGHLNLVGLDHVRNFRVKSILRVDKRQGIHFSYLNDQICRIKYELCTMY